MESQLSELPTELAGVWFGQQWADLRQAIDVKLRPAEVSVVEAVEPRRYLRLDLHDTPCHTSNLTYHACYIKGSARPSCQPLRREVAGHPYRRDDRVEGP